MQNIESLLQQLDADCDLKYVRNAIADLIVDHLQTMKEALGYWETMHLANAIASLALNIDALRQPTTVWFRLSLVALENVLVPEGRRYESSMLQDKQIESLTYEQLMEAIETVRRNG